MIHEWYRGDFDNNFNSYRISIRSSSSSCSIRSSSSSRISKSSSSSSCSSSSCSSSSSSSSRSNSMDRSSIYTLKHILHFMTILVYIPFGTYNSEFSTETNE